MLINVGISTIPAFFIAIFQLLARKYFMQLCMHKIGILHRNEKNPRGNIKFYTFDCINCRAGVKYVDDEFTIQIHNQHGLSVCADEHLHHSFYACMKIRLYWTRVDG